MFPRLSRFYRVLSLCVFLSLLIAFINTRNNILPVQKKSLLSKILLNKVQGDTLIGVENLPGDLKIKGRHTLDKAPVETTIRMVTSEPMCNPHDFHFVTNPKKLCSNRNLTYFIYIHSAPQNYHKRQMVRQTWGSKASLMRYNMRLAFFMGTVDDVKVMDAVEMESSHYGDIVVENFMDSYRNLTYKAIAALKWISLYCPNSTYVIKSDDDIFIDMPKLIDYMNGSDVKKHGTKNVIMCNQWLRMKVIRDKKSKWYISKQEFPDDFFQPYCSGSVFVMTSDVVPAMFNASFYTKFFWVDDFYVTGLLVKRINATQVRWNERYVLNAKLAFQKFKDDKKRQLRFFHVHKMSHIYRMWNMLESKKNVTLCKNCTASSQASTYKVNKQKP